MRKWFSFNNWSLKWKSTMIFLMLVMLPTITIGYMIFYQSNEILKRQVLDTTHRHLNNMESNVLSVINDLEDISGYIIYSDEFRKYMTLSPDDEDYDDIHRLQNNIKGFFTFHLTNKNYFNSVRIEGVNGVVLELGEPVGGDEKRWESLAREQKGKVVWSDPYPLTRRLFTTEEKNVISLFRVINDLYDIRQPVGEIKLRLNERELYEYVTDRFLEKEHETFLVRENGVVMLHRDSRLVGLTYPDDDFMDQIRHSTEEVMSYTYQGEEYFAVKRFIYNRGIYLVSMVKEEYINGELASIRTTMRIMMVLSVFMVLLAVVGFLFTIVKPVIELTRETKRLEYGDFTAHVKVRSNDEIGKLGLRFNKMVKQIQRLIDTKYKLEIQNKESELKALQSQINPHFLYNTLDMIRWTARIEKANETGKSIEDLSRLFRIGLSQGKLWIPLKDEMKYVYSYLELQKKRLAGKLHFYIVMESGLENALVTKLILQPLAENSIEHGFKARAETNRIYIRAYRYERGICIDVIDNGMGLDVEKVNNSLMESGSNDNGFALKNIHGRLETAFGKEFGIQALNGPDEKGAFIRVRLPLIKDELVLRRMVKREDSDDN